MQFFVTFSLTMGVPEFQVYLMSTQVGLFLHPSIDFYKKMLKYREIRMIKLPI